MSIDQNATHAVPNETTREIVRQLSEYPPSKTPGITPLTVVDSDKRTSFEELAQRIEQTRTDHGDVLQKYHEVWYNAPHTWHYTHFLGVGLMKCPNDLWIYQALMHDYRFKTVIETGTYSGASALWFAFLMEMLQIEGGHVYTVDYDDQRRCSHARITFLGGNSADPELVASISEELPEEGSRLVSLDSDHSAKHVYDELCLYAPLCRVGDWLVVEDTNIGWDDGLHDVILWDTAEPDGRVTAKCSCGAIWKTDVTTSDYARYATPNKQYLELIAAVQRQKCPEDHGDRGARGGLTDYLNEHPNEFRQDILCERYLLSMNPGGWLQRIGECSHG